MSLAPDEPLTLNDLWLRHVVGLCVYVNVFPKKMLEIAWWGSPPRQQGGSPQGALAHPGGRKEACSGGQSVFGVVGRYVGEDQIG